MPIAGESIGSVHINVYETPSGETFFYLNADNENVLPMLDYVENILHTLD